MRTVKLRAWGLGAVAAAALLGVVTLNGAGQGRQAAGGQSGGDARGRGNRPSYSL